MDTPRNSAPDVGFVTYAGHPDLDDDDRLLADALAAHGLRAAPCVWDDPAVEWGAFRCAVIRSPWDYQHRRDEFVAWADRIGTLTRLWNPPVVVRWNTHKGYLADLAARGVPIVPTVWLRAGAPAGLAALLDARGWARAVVKPAVSASAFATVLVERAAVAAGQAHLDAWLPGRDMLVQPFLATVGTVGERSLMFVDGGFSHAVRRAPMLGEARAPEEPARSVDAAPDEIALGQAALRAAGFPTLYARLDLIRDEAGALCLMELELVEPFLFLQHAPPAAARLAAAIAARATSDNRGGMRAAG